MSFITIVERESICGPQKESYQVPVRAGACVYDYIPEHIRAMDVVAVFLNREPLNDEQLVTLQPKDGDRLSLAPAMGIWLQLAMLAISIGYQLYEKNEARKAERLGIVGPTYGFDIAQNTYRDGEPIPVVYGTHRIGGQILQQYTAQFEEGIDELYLLFGLCEGPVQAVNPNGRSDHHIDGNLATNYTGVALFNRTGTLTDTVIPNLNGADGSTTTVAASTQLTYNSAVTTTGTASAERFKIKITFPYGLYYQSSTTGHRSGAEWFCTVRYRTTSGPGAWSYYTFPRRPAGLFTTGAYRITVNADSAAGTSRLYTTTPNYLRVGDGVYIGYGTSRQETKTVSAIAPTYIDFTANLTYAHNAEDADLVEKGTTLFTVSNLRMEPFSVYIEGDFPSATTYDVEVTRKSSDHNASTGRYSDAYQEEYQQISDDSLIYPFLAKSAVQAVASAQLSGTVGRHTDLVQGRLIMPIASGTTFSAPTFSNNPADVFADIITNGRYGLCNRIKPRFRMTLNTISGPFTIGEEVRGPAASYQFKGIVRYYSSPTIIVEATQGCPYTSIEGQTSTETANITSVDECTAFDMARLWEFSQFCDEQVPDGGSVTTVDANSNSGQKVLNVASTTTPAFAAGNSVVIGYGTAREESGTIDTVQAGVSITLLANLTYTHTAVQADEVSVAENRAEFDYVYGGEENGWDALERIARCSRAMLFEVGSKLYMRKLASETQGQIVTMGNIVRGSFKVSYLPEGDRPNVLDIVYLDADEDYKKRTASIEDPTAYTNSEPIIRAEMEMYGITRESQANRESYFRLKRARYVGKLIQWQMGIEHIDFEIGDVIYFAHEMPGIGTGSGRVLSSTNSTVTLDHDVTISGGETIRVRLSDDTYETATVTSAAGTHRVLSIAAATWGTNPSRDDIWALGTLGRYRVISLKPKEDLTAEIVAEEDDTAYYVDDYGVLPTFTATTLPDPREIPPDVTNVTLTQGSAVMPDSSVSYFIDVGFLKPDHDAYSRAAIYLKELTGLHLVAGSSDFAPSSSNGEFHWPRGVCSDGTYLYVADKANHRVVKLTQHDLTFSANIGSEGTGNGQFKYPSDVCTDGTHIWVADTENHRIQKITVGGAYVAKIGTNGAGADQFERPFGICHDGTASVFVCDTYNHRLVEVDDALVGSGGGTWTTLGAQGSGADQFERPMGIDHYATGSMLVVADTGNSRIVKVDDGLVGSGGGTWATAGTQGTGTANLWSPEDVATDGVYVYIADSGNHRIVWRLYSDLSYDSTVGSRGNRRNELYHPGGIAHNGDEIYVTERGNNRLQSRDEDDNSNAAYTLQGTTQTQAFRIGGGLAVGESYQVSVVSVSPYGAQKAAGDGATSTIALTNRAVAPPDVTGFTAVNTTQGQLRLTWNSVSAPDFAYYEIRAGSSWATGAVIARTTALFALLSNIAAGYARTYYIKARATSGEYSANADSIAYTPSNSTRAYGGNTASWNLST